MLLENKAYFFNRCRTSSIRDDAFGNILEQTGTANNSITYAGYQWDKETGLYYLNARMYDPVTARFLQEDTYSGDPTDVLSLNLYTYCHNEPLMYSDPTGHWAEKDAEITDNRRQRDIVKLTVIYKYAESTKNNKLKEQVAGKVAEVRAGKNVKIDTQFDVEDFAYEGYLNFKAGGSKTYAKAIMNSLRCDPSYAEGDPIYRQTVDRIDAQGGIKSYADVQAIVGARNATYIKREFNEELSQFATDQVAGIIAGGISGSVKSFLAKSFRNVLKSPVTKEIVDSAKIAGKKVLTDNSGSVKIPGGGTPKGGNNAKLPNQGTVKGNVDDAPSIDAGKQGKHVPGHNNNNPSKSQWPQGQNGVDLTQKAWQNGKTLPDGTKVWDAGKPIGPNGETGVRVHIDGNGNIHGYPINPSQYLK